MLEVYLVTLVGVILTQLAPGPTLLAVAGTSLGQGRKSALITVLGVACAMLVWSLAVSFGLATVLALYPKVLVTMKLLGGSYLLWTAFKAIKSSLTGGDLSIKSNPKPLTKIAAWRRGFFVVLTNPKAGLMWVALGSFLFGAGLTANQVLMFGPVGATTALIIYGGYALLFSTNVAVKIYQRFARWFDFAFGATFGAFGGKLISDSVQELRS